MKKVVLLVLLTCVVLAHYVNCLTLLSPLSVTSKAIFLILFSSGFSSVALLVTLVWLGTWSTTKKPGGLNRLATLVKKEAEIKDRLAQAGKDTRKTIKCDVADYKNFLSAPHCQCPACDFNPYNHH